MLDTKGLEYRISHNSARRLTSSSSVSDLRRTFATLAMDPKTVSSMLGHATTEFSLDAYTNVTREMQCEASKKIGGFMERAV